MNITIITSSIRENRLADNVFIKVKALIADQFRFTLVDPIEYNLPLLNKRYYEMKEPEEKSFVDNFEKNFKAFIKQFEWYTEAFIRQRGI